jgi:arginine/lysine/ornithine decarboxylase
MDRDKTPVLEAIDVHKSPVGSLIPAGAEPVWLRPWRDEARQIGDPASSDDVEAALVRDRDISGMKLPDASDPKLETFRVVRG